MKELKKGYSMLLFWIVFIFTIYNCINQTEYLSNIVSASVIPLFILSVLNFAESIGKGAVEILEKGEHKEEIEYTKNKTTYDLFARLNTEDEGTKSIVEEWNQATEKNAEKIVKTNMVIIKIEKVMKVHFVLYTLANVFLAVSLIMAQSLEWIKYLSKVNGITLAFFAFSILLLESAYKDFLAEKFARFMCWYVLKHKNEKKKQKEST